MTPDPLSLDPKPAESKTRMISFRLTTDEYERFHALCLARGIHLSDVVRSAVNHVLSQDAPELYLDGAARMHSRIQDLESRLETIEAHLNLPRSFTATAGAGATSANNSNNNSGSGE